MATSSKRAYATGWLTHVCCRQRPCPRSCHCWPVPLQETLKHSKKVWLSLCGASESWCVQGFVWPLLASLVGMGFDSKCDFFPFFHLVGASYLPLNVGYLYMVRSNILLLMVVQQWVAVLEFSQEKMSTRPSTLTSCFPIILWDNFCDITIFQFVGHPPGRDRI